MNKSDDRVLATHVGSLNRPKSIRKALQALQLGREFDREAYDRDLEVQVAQVVKQQADVGIDIPSDGEFGKTHWAGYIRQRLSGIDLSDASANSQIQARAGTQDGEEFVDFYKAYEPIVRYDWEPPEDGRLNTSPKDLGMVQNIFIGEVKYIGQEQVARDIRNFKAGLEQAGVSEGFLPTATPMAIGRMKHDPFYKNDEEFIYAIADALHEEYQAIIDAGLLLQVDDASLPQLFDWLRGEPTDQAMKYIEMGIEALNHALTGIPEDRVRFHVCWGSWNGPHTSDAPLRSLLPFITKANVGAYAIEAANPRHEHEWQVWKDVKLPDGKILIPGCISHQTNVVEHPELVEMRLRNFFSVVGKENVIAGTDCGFCQGYNEVRVHPSIQWAKLQSLAQGAELASKP